MARHRADKPEDALDAADDDRADDPASDVDNDPVEPGDDELDEDVTEDEDAAESSGARSSKVDSFWEKVRMVPVEIALPRGVGYTLRAYRMSDTLVADEPEDVADEDAELDDVTPAAEEAEADEKPAAKAKTSAAAKPSGRKRVDEKADEELDEEELDEDELDDEDLEDEDELDEAEEEDEEEEEEEEEAAEPEEVPVFLTQDRRLLLFRSPEGLAEFLRSGEANSLQELDEWDDLSTKVTAEHVTATEEDRYELDLVVENLRGGHDAWDAELLIKAGELCRDLGYALRIESVIGALSTGSPLDDLDEALRSVESGGIGGFFARRKLRRIGAQQAALAWRSIIGKISTSVDWRD